MLQKAYTLYILLRSKKQTGVNLSSTEAEYVALFQAGIEALFLHMLVDDFCGVNREHDRELPPRTSVIFVDNQAAIHIVNNNAIGQRTKHIDTRFRFTNDLVNEKRIKVLFVKGDNNYSDLLTKNVAETVHGRLSPDIYAG